MGKNIEIMNEDRVFVLTRIFDAPIEMVFDAWTKPEQIVHWWGRHPLNLPFCEVDLRPGGTFQICMRTTSGHEYRAKGIYQEILPPFLISCVYAFRDEEGGYETLTTLSFEK